MPRSDKGKHHQRVAPKVSPEQRFFSKVVDLPNGCLQWMGRVDKDGYGQFYLTHSKKVKAHHFAWELDNGPILAGLEIDHLCHNPGCVNVMHMELVTNKENVRRGWTKHDKCTGRFVPDLSEPC